MKIIFFSWLEKIDCIQKVYGEGESIFLDSCQQVSHDDLRELIAIFHRYNIDMKQLKKFMNDENEQWLTNTKAYWYPNMFVN